MSEIDEGDVTLRDGGGPGRRRGSDGDEEGARRGGRHAAQPQRPVPQPRGSRSDVIITDVGLPDVIVQQMAEKTP